MPPNTRNYRATRGLVSLKGTGRSNWEKRGKHAEPAPVPFSRQCCVCRAREHCWGGDRGDLSAWQQRCRVPSMVTAPRRDRCTESATWR